MRYAGAEIAQHSGGQLLADGPRGPLVTDSRALKAGDWFLALVGERFDGHAFLDKAAAAHCAGAVVSADAPAGWDRGLVRVPDTLVALQDVAAASRAGFGGPVVAITGSVGKTTTRALTVLAVADGEVVHHTQGNLNNHIGLPLTLLARRREATLMVLELGMNAPGEIALLQRICRPTVRIITNVAPAHLEGLGTIEGVARAKGELFDGARSGDVVCVNMDDPRVAALPLPAGLRVLRYGRSQGCDLRLREASLDASGPEVQVRFVLEHGSRVVRGSIPAPGLYMAANACAAVAVALALGKDPQRAAESLAGYAPVGARMALADGPGGIRVLNDAYNANPASMGAALETLCALPAPRRVALLGDMLELGPTEIELHRELLERALGLELALVGACGPRMQAASEGLAGHDGLLVAPDAEALSSLLAPRLLPGDLVLLKGSRGMAMERILRTLRHGQR
jgi:UDP-N-acetylmuramoyl-tripeptide--D-alanyl-D-alanine ligase